MENDKFYFAQKYEVPEKDIIPEFIFILKAIDKQSEKYEDLKSEMKEGLQITNYEGFWPTLAVKLSSVLLNILLATISVTIITLLVNYIIHQKNFYKNLEALNQIVSIKDDQYYIPKNIVSIKKDGVYFNATSRSNFEKIKK